jgi:hypothetical protein
VQCRRVSRRLRRQGGVVDGEGGFGWSEHVAIIIAIDMIIVVISYGDDCDYDYDYG